MLELICTKEAGVMLKMNESGWDRIVRVALGAILLYLGWAGVVTGGWGLAFKVLGFVPLLTGAVGWCPIYAALKFGTKTA
jgi:hypothetical protein